MGAHPGCCKPANLVHACRRQQVSALPQLAQVHRLSQGRFASGREGAGKRLADNCWVAGGGFAAEVLADVGPCLALHIQHVTSEGIAGRGRRHHHSIAWWLGPKA